MSDQIELLAGQKQKGESSKAIQACNDYLRMGAGRSLPRLFQKYRELPQNTAPTLSLNTLQKWSQRYDWQERATVFDAEVEQRKNEYRREVMESGLALDYERVIELKRLAGFLIEQVYEQGEDGVYHNVWVPDVKQIGGGEYAERVDIERFNSALIGELRGTLDDLAKETNGRIQRTEVTGKDGAAMQHDVRLSVDNLAEMLAEAEGMAEQLRQEAREAWDFDG